MPKAALAIAYLPVSQGKTVASSLHQVGGFCTSCRPVLLHPYIHIVLFRYRWVIPSLAYQGTFVSSSRRCCVQMRIALARLLLGPAGQSASSGGQGGLLLLDEPTNHLDRYRACSSNCQTDDLTGASASWYKFAYGQPSILPGFLLKGVVFYTAVITAKLP